MYFSRSRRTIWHFAKYVVILIVIYLATFALQSKQFVFADTLTEVEKELAQNVDEGLSAIDFSDFSGVGFDFAGDIADRIKKIINGDFENAENFGMAVISVFLSELKEILPSLVIIFVILVIVGLCKRTNDGLMSESTNSTVSFVALTSIVTLLISLLAEIYKNVFGTIKQIGTLCDVASPIMLTLLFANGGTVTSSICQPSMILFSSTIIKFVSNVLAPVSLVAVVFVFVGNISSNVKMQRLSNYTCNVCSWALGVAFMIFFGFTAVQGIAATKIDGVSFRLAKFAAKSYVPIIGGYVADGFDMVMASTTLIKNAFGVVALWVLVGIIIKPLLLIISLKIGLSVTTAIGEPLMDEKHAKTFDGLNKCLGFWAAMLIAVAFMFAILMLICMNCVNGV